MANAAVAVDGTPTAIPNLTTGESYLFQARQIPGARDAVFLEEAASAPSATSKAALTAFPGQTFTLDKVSGMDFYVWTHAPAGAEAVIAAG